MAQNAQFFKKYISSTNMNWKYHYPNTGSLNKKAQIPINALKLLANCREAWLAHVAFTYQGFPLYNCGYDAALAIG